jgi:hypothetical protein
MFHTVITRKNLISLSLSVFYSLLLLFVGVCIDADSSLIYEKNPIAMMGSSLGFAPVDAKGSAFICLILVAFYINVMVLALCYEKRYAIVNGQRALSAKMLSLYIGTVLACIVLSFGFGLLIHLPLTAVEFTTIAGFIWESLVISAIIYFVLFIGIGAIVMLVFNLILVDKPFKFFNDKEKAEIGDEIEANLDVNSSFDANPQFDGLGDSNGIGGAAGGVGGAGGDGELVVSDTAKLDDREKVFPALSKIDIEYEGFVNEAIDYTPISLEELCEGFHKYLAKEEKLYFDINVIRFFVCGFAASHFEILEGLSGTGKSSLPRYFAKYTGSEVLFMPVQATWRDKTNIIGFFNEFSKTYTETDFLCRLYSASYNPDKLYFYVLDEMNISRVEYYFADLLSVLEFPKNEWRLKLMQMPYGFIAPMQLDDGNVRIPDNSYFVGTANKDDSTFTITDKVYDRAITIDFTENNKPFTVKEDTPKIQLSNTHLKSLFETALADPDAALNDSDREKMDEILAYVYENFDIAIGNRILTQIDRIVPVFVTAGGTKECAIDLMLSRKLIAKIEGRFEEHIKSSLQGLLRLIDKVYGSGVMKNTEKLAKNIIKSL